MAENGTQNSLNVIRAMASEVAEVTNPSGRHEIVLVCEHASAFIPAEFDQLGVSADIATSHIAWDPGAGETVAALAGELDAVLLRGLVSRLIYDCNRPPESTDAIRQTGEHMAIPGNCDLNPIERAGRVERFYLPFRQMLADTLASHHTEPVLVTVHTFTPVFEGRVRPVEIGIVHDTDRRFADAVFDVARGSEGSRGFDIRRNEPYGPEDGVTHTLREHALPKGLLNVMIEIRNDLVATSEQCRMMAAMLKGWLEQALTDLRSTTAQEMRA